jgi:hypothetical protein
MKTARYLALALSLGIAACEGRSPVEPVALTPTPANTIMVQINGSIVDGLSGAPVPDAKLTMTRSDIGGTLTILAPSGTFKATVPAATWKVVASAPGHRDLPDMITVSPMSVWFTFRLLSYP